MRALRSDACRADRRSRLWAGTLILLAATVSVRAHSATPGVQKNGFVLDGAVIPIAEIFQGGPPRDGIPSIDAPQFEAIPEADAFLHGDDLVLSLDLPHGIEGSLVSTLEGAKGKLEVGQSGTAINKLEAFINQIKAQSGKKLDEADAAEMVAAAEAIIAAIQTPGACL